MSSIRLYLPSEYSEGVFLPVLPAQAHYLAHVMRLKAGDRLFVFNGIDGEWQAQVATVSKKELTLQLLNKILAQKSVPDVWLAFAPLKNKTPIVVEKAVELGVSRLLPVYTHRSIVRSVNEEKLVLQAIEAAEQCERHDVPEIQAFDSLAQLLSHWPKDRILLFADENGSGQDLKTLLPSLSVGAYGVLVGPEGGFTEEERTLLSHAKHVIAFSMGPRILRADTAAVAALSCLLPWVGDWQEKPRFEYKNI